MEKIQLGTDKNGTPLFPGDIVIVDGREMKIEFDVHRELFGFGDVHGYYVPDYCEKVERET